MQNGVTWVHVAPFIDPPPQKGEKKKQSIKQNETNQKMYKHHQYIIF